MNAFLHRRPVQIALVVFFALLTIHRFLPSIPLAILPHRSTQPPDPADEPIQKNLPAGDSILAHRARLKARATFSAMVEVVSIERYRFDAASFIIPYDIAVIWGGLRDEPYHSNVRYHQNGRFYIWGTSSLDLDRNFITAHSANIHLIPASSRLKRVLGLVRSGNIVKLSGLLVDVEGTGGKEGFRWATSLSRQDDGAGACETLYLKEIAVGSRLYRAD